MSDWLRICIAFITFVMTLAKYVNIQEINRQNTVSLSKNYVISLHSHNSTAFFFFAYYDCVRCVRAQKIKIVRKVIRNATFVGGIHNSV